MTPEEFRQQAMQRGLDREQLAHDPIRQFEHWFGQAMEAQIPEANAMSLATVSPDDHPSVRTVLLKRYDQRGFVFFTNYESRKARDIACNPAVALLFPWVALGRQVKISGIAVKLSVTESLRYFSSRARGSQIGAWASPQSRVIESRALLDASVRKLKRSFAEGRIPLPSFWGGFCVQPHTIEFWQSRADRLHDRFVYRRDQDRWTVERLAP